MSRIRPSRVLIAARKRREAASLPGAQVVEETAAAPVDGDADAQWMRYAYSDTERYGYQIRSDDPVPPRSAGYGEYYAWRQRQMERAWRERHHRYGEPNESWGLSELMQYGLQRGLQLPDPRDESTLTEANFNFARLYRDIVARQARGNPKDGTPEHNGYTPPQPDIHNTSVSPSTLRAITRAFEELQKENPGKRVKQVDVARRVGVSAAAVSKAKEVVIAEAARLGTNAPHWATRPVVGAGRRRK